MKTNVNFAAEKQEISNMESMTLSSGSLLKHGEYRIVRVLGQGGFGITYEAEQVSLGRRVAVKEFFMKDHCNRDGSTSHVSVPSVGSRELVDKFRQKFLREARMIAGLDHEHIVRVFDVFEENGTAYYVMEYLPGGSLADGVKRGEAMPEGKAVGYVRQVGDALQYLHSQNILHFDVKPSNVLLGKNGSAKLIDFGISKHYDESGSQTSSTPIGISKGFAPLEQYQQGSDIQTFTPATDIYALGATLYALLAGSNPPEASVVNEDGVPFIDGLSSATLRAIESAMQSKRKDRPQSVAEFLQLFDKEELPPTDDEDTLLGGAEKPEKPNKSANHATPSKPKKPVNQTKSATPKKPEPPITQPKAGFPKWLWSVVAVLVVGAATFGLLRRPSSPSGGDVPPTDSVATVTEVIQQPEETEPVVQTIPVEPAVVALESLSLNKKNLELAEGASATLTAKYMPANTTDKSTTWESSDESVAKVSPKGKVTAVSAGNAAIAATCGGKTAYCNVTVTPKSTTATSTTNATSTPVADKPSATSTSGKENGHEWVDLGLSVKWATMNVGATSPEGYGSYFAWGETKPKSDYDWSPYKWCKGSMDTMTKYCTDSKYGTVDNKRVLDLSDDAARANWGGNWRMPTLDEIMELKLNCTSAWTTQNGVKGLKVTSKKNGNSIFLPAAGDRVDDDLNYAGSSGYYWSSTLDPSHDYSACSLYFNFDSGYWGLYEGYGRYSGQSVRAVCP